LIYSRIISSIQTTGIQLLTPKVLLSRVIPKPPVFFTPGYSFGVLILILDQNHQKVFHHWMKTKRYSNGLYEVIDDEGRSWWLAQDEKTKKWEARVTSFKSKPASSRKELIEKLEGLIGEVKHPDKA
jgi:hypothetical protein